MSLQRKLVSQSHIFYPHATLKNKEEMVGEDNVTGFGMNKKAE